MWVFTGFISFKSQNHYYSNFICEETEAYLSRKKELAQCLYMARRSDSRTVIMISMLLCV